MEQSYKEKYEQALAKAKEQYNYPCMRSCMGILEEIFPELKESGDEKVRKALIDFFSKGAKYGGYTNGVYDKDILAWLEKQEGCEYIKKDWLEHIKQSWYKEGLIDGKYSGGTSKEWTINDAATLKELIDFLENGTAKLQHDLTRYANWLKNQFTPIIERQGEQNFEMKTAAESLGVDSETYNKIVDECIFGEQKPEENKGNIGGISPNWSEEDKKMLDSVIGDILNADTFIGGKETASYKIDWLQSLQDRVQPQPKQEWNEEDEPQKELAESYLAKFDEKFPILPTLKGKQLADYKNFLNKCQQIFRLKYWGIRPIQAKLFEKLSLLWAAWGAEHLQGLGQTYGDMDDEILWSEEDEQHIDSLLKRLDALCRNKFERTRFAISEDRDWLKSLRPQPQWKPSDEHISLLQAIINDPNNASSESCQIVLKDILEQLKKLKEE